MSYNFSRENRDFTALNYEQVGTAQDERKETAKQTFTIHVVNVERSVITRETHRKLPLDQVVISNPCKKEKNIKMT